MPLGYTSEPPPRSSNRIRNLISKHDVIQKPLEIKGWTRWNLAARDQSSDEQYRFLMPGPQVSEDEVRARLSLLGSLDPRPDAIVLSGSLPPGFPASAMRDLAAVARGHEARLVADTSGEALEIAAGEGVFLLKPNMRELQELTDENTSTEAGQEKAIRRLVRDGECEVAILAKLHGLKTASGTAWDQARDGVATARSDLESAFQAEDPIWKTHR